MIAEEIFDAAITEEELDALLAMDTKEMMNDLFPLDLDDNQLHSWDDTLPKMVMEDNPEMMKEKLDALFMMDREETEATKHSQPQPLQETLQETKKKKNQEADQETKKKGDLQNAGMIAEEIFDAAITEEELDALLAMDTKEMMDDLFPLDLDDNQLHSWDDTLPKMLQSQQPLQSQPQPQVWTWEENKAFESVMANCFQDAIHNHWKTVAAQLPGKTPAQLQERFLKVMTDVNAIKHGYPQNISITIPVPATPLEHCPLSISIVNATPPPPPPHWTHHHHRWLF
ncbi:hypothetical protein AHAS_Ahas18G0283500 [Arachis hypogaea]